MLALEWGLLGHCFGHTHMGYDRLGAQRLSAWLRCCTQAYNCSSLLQAYTLRSLISAGMAGAESAWCSWHLCYSVLGGFVPDIERAGATRVHDKHC